MQQHRMTLNENRQAQYWITCSCGFFTHRTTVREQARQWGISHYGNPILRPEEELCNY